MTSPYLIGLAAGRAFMENPDSPDKMFQCPYPEGSIDAALWNKGFNEGTEE